MGKRGETETPNIYLGKKGQISHTGVSMALISHRIYMYITVTVNVYRPSDITCISGVNKHVGNVNFIYISMFGIYTVVATA